MRDASTLRTRQRRNPSGWGERLHPNAKLEDSRIVRRGLMLLTRWSLECLPCAPAVTKSPPSFSFVAQRRVPGGLSAKPDLPMSSLSWFSTPSNSISTRCHFPSLITALGASYLLHTDSITPFLPPLRHKQPADPHRHNQPNHDGLHDGDADIGTQKARDDGEQAASHLGKDEDERDGRRVDLGREYPCCDGESLLSECCENASATVSDEGMPR